MNKKIIIVITLLIIIFSIPSYGVEIDFSCSDENCFFQVWTIFSESVRNSILASPLVTEIYENNLTRVTIIYTTLEPENPNIEAFTEYLSNAGDLNEINYQRSQVFPDTLPAPICIRDYVTGEMNAIYSVDNTLFLNVEDARCVS